MGMFEETRNMRNNPIGIFDSGVGGLTVMRSVIDRLPRESIIYYGDTARGPYGSKDLTLVRKYAMDIAAFLEDLGVKMIVIACNSATAAGLGYVKNACEVPVIGVIEPGALEAVRRTRNQRVGVIGTKATIESGAYTRRIGSLSRKIEITSRDCPLLVEFVERGEVEGAHIEQVLEEYLEPMRVAGVDTLILGCTHYPLLHKPIARVIGDGVTIISSADATAAEVERVLAEEGLARDTDEPRTYRFLCSGDTELARRLGRMFLGPEVEHVEKASL